MLFKHFCSNTILMPLIKYVCYQAMGLSLCFICGINTINIQGLFFCSDNAGRFFILVFASEVMSINTAHTQDGLGVVLFYGER